MTVRKMCKSLKNLAFHSLSAAFLREFISQTATQPGTIADACKPSRWAVTLMDALTLGSLVDGRNERNSGCYKPGKVLPARGHDLELYCEQPTLNPINFTFTYLEVASASPGGGVNLIGNSNLSWFGIYCHDFLATYLSLSTRFVLSQ